MIIGRVIRLTFHASSAVTSEGLMSDAGCNVKKRGNAKRENKWKRMCG
jgi:hypothetical protein